MNFSLSGFIIACLFLTIVHEPEKPHPVITGDESFADFENVFLDSYWKQYPTGSIYSGYGKYYDELVIPDKSSFNNNITFSKAWMDSLAKLDFETLNDNNKISYHIIKNQLESDIWYTSVFKPQEWDASMYNISGACDYIINQPYAPLDERLMILTRYLAHADDYFKAALINLSHPVREYIEMSIMQNEGGLEVFGTALSDSIQTSHLSQPEREQLDQNIHKAVNAIKEFAGALKRIDEDKNSTFRSFRIGKKLFDQKFKYDIATDLTPEQVYGKAIADKNYYHRKMYVIANSLWTKYYGAQVKPKDSLQLVQLVLDKVQLNHAKPADFYDSLSSYIHQLKRFIIVKNLFDFDTTSPPIKVRFMPVYERGFTLASAEFTPAYQKQGTTYFNVDDVTLYPSAKAESALREYNHNSAQLLAMHEGVPGHCLQGIYNNKKSPDVLRSVFTNGAMIEGWAVYSEGMMVENGWGNGAPEMELELGVWRLRELANVIVDYDLQCLDIPKDQIVHLLSKECFQTDAQVEEKYHRATVSQVQLCSYYTGATAIQKLRDEYKKKMGNQYSLKSFHEKFLSFGSSPVKYIREMMLK
jgi:uncharacterized protein (DUF885 family)